MNNNIEKVVYEFIQSELPLVTTILLKKVPVGIDLPLQQLHEADDVAEMANKYFREFNVDPAGFTLEHYFPWKTAGFMRRWFNAEPIGQDKQPLTVKMFAESAKAGKWLYG